MLRAGPTAAVSGLSDGSSSWAAVPRAAESGRLGRTGKRVCRLAGEPEPQAEQNFKSLAAAASGSSAASHAAITGLHGHCESDGNSVPWPLSVGPG